MSLPLSTADDWGRIPDDVLRLILDILSQEQSWNKVASVLSSVNAHWRSAILDCITVLKPRHCSAFQFPKDIKTLSQFPNLQSLLFAESFSYQSKSSTPRKPLKAAWDSDAVMGRKQVTLNKLQYLKLENFESLDEVLSTFSSAHSLKHLVVKKGHLRRFPKKLVSLSELRTLILKNVELVSSEDGLDLLKSMKQLESLTLSFRHGANLGSVAHLSRLQKLKTLRISHTDFDFSNVHALSRLEQLSTLVLDGTVYGNMLDLSSLTQLVHLSISSQLMPSWIPSMSSLQSLKLTTYDTFKDQLRQQALLSIAAQLTTLHLEATKTTRTIIKRILRASRNLERLSLSQQFDAFECLKHLPKLKALIVKSPILNRTYFDHNVLSAVQQLPNLESLVLDTSYVLYEHLFSTWHQRASIRQRLRELVLWEVRDDVLKFVIRSLSRLRVLQLLGRRPSVRPFLGMSASDLPELSSLCLRLPCRLPFVGSFLKLKFLKRLDHLAFQKEFLYQWSDKIAEFSRRAPQVVIDDDFDLMHVFEVRDPFKSKEGIAV